MAQLINLMHRYPCQRNVIFLCRKHVSFLSMRQNMIVSNNNYKTIVENKTLAVNCILGINSDLTASLICEIQKRFYAKGKNKGREGKPTHSHITDEELSEVINVDNFRGELDEAMENLREDYAKKLSLRSSIGSLETLEIELDGDTYPLSEIAQIIRKSPTMIIINATAFPQASSNIKKAILESGMNLNPQQEGTSFFIPIPKVTKEQRENLAKNAKMMCDKTKSVMREIQNKFVKKTRSKEGKLSEDLIFNAQVKIREITQKTSLQAEELMKTKQKELLATSK